MSAKTLRLILVCAAVLVADQGSKYLAVAHLTRAFQVSGAQSLPARLTHFASDRHLEGTATAPDLRTAPVAVLPNFWHFKYVENPGAAWGLLGQLPGRLRMPFFHAVTLAAVVFILAFYRRLAPRQVSAQAALAMVLGGALGNYLGRVVRGYVIDFIDWHWYQAPGMHWPTFNIADAAICVGVGMLLLDGAFAPKPAAANPPSKPPLDQPQAP